MLKHSKNVHKHPHTLQTVTNNIKQETKEEKGKKRGAPWKWRRKRRRMEKLMKKKPPHTLLELWRGLEGSKLVREV